MERLQEAVHDLTELRANEMEYVEEELTKIKDSVKGLNNSVVSLTKKFAMFEALGSKAVRPAPVPAATTLSPEVARLINAVNSKVSSVESRLSVLERSAQTKQSTVFGARINTTENLKDKTWKKINKCDTVYNSSLCFIEDTCSFKAPVKGDYFLDMGVRQAGKGGLEVALHGSGTTFKHSYVGNTSGESQVCHKTVIVSLNSGDCVYGIVRRMSGEATINWCAFHGCLISDASTPSLYPSAPSN